MKYLFSILLCISICCTETKEGIADKISLEGDWFYIDERDSSYTELYFSDSFVYVNQWPFGVTNLYKYNLANDSLFISEPTSEDPNYFAYKVLKNNGIDIFIETESNSFMLVPIDLDPKFFSDIHVDEINEEYQALFFKGKMEREVKVMKKHGLIDTIQHKKRQITTYNVDSLTFDKELE